MNSRVGVVQRVGPVAVCREREAAIAASGLRLRREGGFLIIDVGDGELARRGELGVFGDRTGIRAADDGAIVAAADSDNQLLGGGCACTIGHADRNGQCLSLALSQMLVGRVNWLEAVAAIGVERKAIYRISEAEGECVTGIHICGNHLPTELGAVFRDRLALRDKYRRIIAAGDCDGDGVGRAAHRLDVEAVGQGFACLELLNSSLAVVGAVVPLTVGVEAEATITARHIGLCGEMVLPRIRVGDCQLSTGFELACRQVGVFSDGAAVHSRNHCAIIMAVDGNGDLVSGAVDRLNSEAVGQCAGL